jgi:hypothetical protein
MRSHLSGRIAVLSAPSPERWVMAVERVDTIELIEE